MPLHPVDELFVAMTEVEPYPSGVIAPPGRISGIAFFPGGAGLWGEGAGMPLPPMPRGGVMVLGHDFHSEAGFQRSLAAGGEVWPTRCEGERTPPTWRHLLALLEEVKLSAEYCFFTNAYMGLREGSGTTGRFPGSRDESFVERCRRFLVRQLTVQAPALVLTLGAWVPAFLAPLSPQLAGWRAVRSLRTLDMAGPLVHGVTFPDTGVDTCSVVALTHPSLRGPNVRRRRYAGLEGHQAEVAMLHEAIAGAPMTLM